MVEPDRKRAWLENLVNIRKKKEEELNKLEIKKKKELEELEDKKKKELKEAEEILKSEFEGLQEDEEKETIEASKKKPEKEPTSEENLEEAITKQRISKESQEAAATGSYGTPIEDILASANAVNQRSDLYGDLKSTLEKIQRGQYLSQQERDEFYHIQEEFNKADKFEEDKFGYVQRSKEVMSAVYQSLHQTSYKTGDDH